MIVYLKEHQDIWKILKEKEEEYFSKFGTRDKELINKRYMKFLQDYA